MSQQYSTRPRKTVRLHHSICFGLEGNDSHYLGQGWADAELDGRWTSGEISEIRLINPNASDLLLEIYTKTLKLSTSSAAPQIKVLANGVSVGTITLVAGHWVAMHIANDRVPIGDILTLSFMHLGAKHSAGFDDGEIKGVNICFSHLRVFTVAASPRKCNIGKGGISPSAFQYRTGVAANEGLSWFECLSESVEFAQLQAQIGVNAPMLLSSARIEIADLLRGFDADFAGLGEPGSFDVKLNVRNLTKYSVIDRTYSATFHCTQNEDEIMLADLMLQQGTRLRELRRTLMQVLAEGEKIFVLLPPQDRPLPTEQEVLTLLIALNQHGPNWLLWINEVDAERPAGTVEQTIPFLLRGSIDRLQPGAHVEDRFIEKWLELCANALGIAQPASLAARLLSDRSAPVVVAEELSPSAPVKATAPGVTTTARTSPPKEGGEAPAAETQGEPTIKPPEGEYLVLQKLTFGDGGNEQTALGFGWAEPDIGYRWTTEAICELWLNHPGQRNVVVTIEAWPFVLPPALELQRVEVSAHDTQQASLSFTVPARLAVYVSRTSLRTGRILRLRCTLPDATRPCDVADSEDDRKLALGFYRVAVHEVSGRLEDCKAGLAGLAQDDVRARTGMELEELFSCFETIGESQALLEMQVGIEKSPSLFKRANITLLNLVRAIDNSFVGFGELENLKCSLFSQEPEAYEIMETTTSLNYVVERRVGDSSSAILVGRESRRLRMLRDKFLHELALGDKIFVYHQSAYEEVLSEVTMLPLLIAMRQHGPNTLLFITTGDDAHPPGTVERVFPGLLHGYLRGLEQDHNSTKLKIWAELLVNAWELSAGS